MSVHVIYYEKRDKKSIKMMRPVKTREEYLALRGSTKQRNLLKAVRNGDEKKKMQLVQMNYSCLPNADGTLAGSTTMSNTVGMDIDHLKPEELESVKQRILSKKDELGLLMLEKSARGEGYHLVFKRHAEMTQEENLQWASELLGVKFDEGAKDITRVFFTTCLEDLIFLEEEIFENDTLRYETATPLRSELRSPEHLLERKKREQARYENENGNGNVNPLNQCEARLEPLNQRSDLNQKVLWLGYDVQKIIDERFKKGIPSAKTQSRHDQSLKLARDLMVMLDRDKELTLQVLKQQSWVREIIEERNEPVDQTVDSALAYIVEHEKKYGAYYALTKPMQNAIKTVTGKTIQELKADPNENGNEGQGDEGDSYAMIPLQKFADELKRLSRYYPCMKELFLNVHPQKMPAVFFSAAAMFGTLMTRAWYHFWYDPELVRRLNYSIFIIGDPGAGKNVVEKFYNRLAEPMIKADKTMIDAVNRYKEGRTERTTSTKAQKGDALKKPVVGIRVHPARTANGEFIRHMLAAVEDIQGRKIHLHMFSFDSELDNINKNNKGGDYKDKEVLELKAFHNEQDGQMYANTESVTGMFNVYWNFIYTGTPYALHRKVNQRNFGTGMSTRLAVIPLPDVGLAKRKQQVDENANETLTEWAYRLDKVEGEIPIEPLNDETYEWQSARLEVAEFNGDKADRTLLKRIPYYGIGISLPFILMRHWDEWQENHTLTMDAKDRQLCRLAMEIQYRCQQFFFGEMAHNYFEDQNKALIARRRTTRYDDCYRKLPDEFKTQQFMDCFGVSQPTASRSINRLIHDGLVKRVAYMKYKKLTQELP